MTDFQLAVLAFIQGITEFLPISSSGHLLLAPHISGWQDQGLIIDVAVHLGSLVAVVLYWHKDVWSLIQGSWAIATFRRSPSKRLVWLLIVSTLPVVAAGFAISHFGISDLVREPAYVLYIVGWSTLGFGLLLWFGDSIGLTIRRVTHLDFADALLLGLAQCLALIPGASRSGTTITMARLLGMERVEAARFSMLMSIPAILAAGTLKTKDLIESGDPVLTGQAATAAGLSFLAAIVSIWAMMKWFQSRSMKPFVFYRIALGVVLLAVAEGLF